MPTLSTANRLVRALGHESIHALEMAHDAVNRVERALRLDRLLDAPSAHRIMQLYLSLRGRTRDSTNVAVRRVPESHRSDLGGGPPA